MPFAPFNLTGKVALVTGGNSGIGLGFAEGLAQAGAAVCIWGTNPKKNETAGKHLRQFSEHVLALQVDVGDGDAVHAAFLETVERFGRVDACFANAGIGSRGTAFTDMTIEEWRDIFRVNMEGVFHTFQAAVMHIVARGGGGSLVATSSDSAIFGAPRAEHYAATKAGLHALVRALAVEHGRDGIRANAVLPGWIETPMTENFIRTEKYEERVLRRVPLRRWGTGADFAGVAVYLASDASAYHTGDTIIIDGGYSVF